MEAVDSVRRSHPRRGVPRAKLIYSAITSLGGYVADEDGNFDWSAPDAEVHAFVNDLERPIGTYLFGRRLYEGMAVWETWDTANSRRSCGTTLSCGAPPTRSSTRGRSRPSPAREPASSAISIPWPSAR